MKILQINNIFLSVPNEGFFAEVEQVIPGKNFASFLTPEMASKMSNPSTELFRCHVWHSFST